jgi:hypothetical protein
LAERFVGFGGAPDDGLAAVGEPPDADVFVGGPEGGRPLGEDFGERVEGLLPSDFEGGDGAEGHFDDYPQSAEGAEGGAEEGGVLFGGAGDDLSIREEYFKRSNRLRDEAVLERGPVGAC